MIYENNQYSNNQYGKNRNGNKYGGKYGIKAYNLRSGKHDTQSDAKDVDFEASVINAIESDANMNNNYGKEDQQLQYEKQNNGGDLYCIADHLPNSYSVLGDQDSRLNENSLLYPATHSISGHHSAEQQLYPGLHLRIYHLHIYHISFIVIPTGLVGNARIEISTETGTFCTLKVVHSVLLNTSTRYSLKEKKVM